MDSQKPFNLVTFLAKADGGSSLKEYAVGQTVFCQEDPADAVFYIQKGEVKLTVVSHDGKEAVIGMLGQADFFGEGCLTGQQVRLSTAVASIESRRLRWRRSARIPGAPARS